MKLVATNSRSRQKLPKNFFFWPKKVGGGGIFSKERKLRDFLLQRRSSSLSLFAACSYFIKKWFFLLAAFWSRRCFDRKIEKRKERAAFYLLVWPVTCFIRPRRCSSVRRGSFKGSSLVQLYLTDAGSNLERNPSYYAAALELGKFVKK